MHSLFFKFVVVWLFFRAHLGYAACVKLCSKSSYQPLQEAVRQLLKEKGCCANQQLIAFLTSVAACYDQADVWNVEKHAFYNKQERIQNGVSSLTTFLNSDEYLNLLQVTGRAGATEAFVFLREAHQKVVHNNNAFQGEYEDVFRKEGELLLTLCHENVISGRLEHLDHVFFKKLKAVWFSQYPFLKENENLPLQGVVHPATDNFKQVILQHYSSVETKRLEMQQKPEAHIKFSFNYFSTKEKFFYLCVRALGLIGYSSGALAFFYARYGMYFPTSWKHVCSPLLLEASALVALVVLYYSLKFVERRFKKSFFKSRKGELLGKVAQIEAVLNEIRIHYKIV